jgi:hypothetical protein
MDGMLGSSEIYLGKKDRVELNANPDLECHLGEIDDLIEYLKNIHISKDKEYRILNSHREVKLLLPIIPMTNIHPQRLARSSGFVSRCCTKSLRKYFGA